MNVLLIKPYIVTDEIQPPLGLGYLATSIRDKHYVKIIDGIRDKFTIKDLREELSSNSYDVIGVQCYTLDMNIVRDMIDESKKVSKNIKAIVGGPQPSADPVSVFSYLKADYGFKGEAEMGLPLLLDMLEGKRVDEESIPGLIWIKGNKIMINNQEFINDLDDLGHPSWDLLSPTDYPPAPHGAFFKRLPIAPIFATRGCPFQCTFCAGFLVSGRRIRYRSIKNLVDEIQMLHEDYGINEFHIEDDNFSMKRQYVVDFCNELIERNLDIAWACPNGMRLDSLDEDLIRLMKKTGLHVVSLGIESGSERILREMKKSLTKKKISEKVSMLHKTDIDLVGFFILGYPGETVKDINATIDYACRLPLKRASFMAFKPFPGTEARNKIDEQIKNKKIKIENFALNKIVYSPKGISQKKLRKLRHKALIKFYFRPHIMFSFFRYIKSYSHAIYVFKRAFRWLSQ
jgi:radical SAM superfamily enzyme YgiQ (UPF0313 family)